MKSGPYKDEEAKALDRYLGEIEPNLSRTERRAWACRLPPSLKAKIVEDGDRRTSDLEVMVEAVKLPEPGSDLVEVAFACSHIERIRSAPYLAPGLLVRCRVCGVDRAIRAVMTP